MLRLMVSMFIGIAIAGNAQAVITTSWGAGSTGAYLYDSAGALLDSGVGTYQIQLVIDVNSDTDMTQLMSGYVGLTGDSGTFASVIDATASDDVIWTADMRDWQDGGGGISFFLESDSSISDTYASDLFYFRWFDAANQASASEAGIIYGTGGSGNLSGFQIGAVPPAPSEPAVNLDYGHADSTGSAYTGGANDGWQTIAPVPEPSTMGLMLVGAGVLAYRRRKQRS